jgi:predicted TIM-barrel fold metal-dependent hydrolase
MSDFRFLRYADAQDVVRITLARPPLNILTTEMLHELGEALERAALGGGAELATSCDLVVAAEPMSVCYKWDTVWFGIDAWMPKYLKPEILNFIGSRMGQDRAVWGTNGLGWKESLDQVDGLGLRPEARQKLIRDNAQELFRL